MDEAHRQTDKLLAEIERKLRKEYRQATKETEEKLNKYFKAFERKDAAKREQVKNGEISSSDYKKWRVSQLAVGKRWEDMRDALAQDMANTNIIARSIADGYMPQVYAENHNFATYQIEKGARIDTSYTLYDAQSVERLIRENPDILPKPGRTTQELIDSGVLQKWDKRVIQSTMIQGILQGESIPKLAKRMAHDLGEKEYKSVVRHARTMTTATQNAGRVDGFKRAKGMGIDVKQTWVATLDGRTRHEHRVLDGQTREVGEYFEAEGYKIRYPGDPEAAYAMIMNCRCTLIGQIKGFERDTTAYRQDKALGGMTYDEWKNEKAKVKQQDKPKAAFIPALSLQQAEEYAKRFVTVSKYAGEGNVSYKGMSLEMANHVNEVLTNVYDEYDLPPMRNIEPMNLRKNIFKDAKDAPFCYRGLFAGELYFNPNIIKTDKTLNAYMQKGKEAFDYCAQNLDKFSGKQKEMVEIYLKAGRQTVADTKDDPLKAMIEHEMGHHVQHQIITKDKDYIATVKAGFDEYGGKISGYATSSVGEYIAESFSAYNNGDSGLIDPKLRQIFKGIGR